MSLVASISTQKNARRPIKVTEEVEGNIFRESKIGKLEKDRSYQSKTVDAKICISMLKNTSRVSYICVCLEDSANV